MRYLKSDSARLLGVGWTLSLACLLSLASAQEPPAEEVVTSRVSLNLAGQEVNEAMQMLADATGLNILVSPNAKGPITAFVEEMDAEQALKEIVEVNGFHYVKNGNVVWVLSDKEYYEDFNLGRERRVVPLAHARATEIVASITPALSKNGLVVPYPENNVVIIAETASRIGDIEMIIRSLDVSPSTRTFQLRHAAAEEVQALIQYQVPLPTGIQADRRTNQLIVNAPRETLDRIALIVEDLDKPDMIRTQVFALKYADATETASVIREILTGRRESSATSPLLGSPTGSQPQEGQRVLTTEPARPNAARPLEAWDRMRGRGAQPTSQESRAGQLTSTSTPGTATGATTPAAEMSPSGEGPLPTGSKEDVALGPLSSVVADIRTNSVIVTHVQSVLDRIEQIVATLDVPGVFHTYQFQNVNPAELEIDARLAPLFPSVGSFVAVDPVSKKVTFRAPEDQAEDVLRLMREWDDAVRQVRIEAEIMSVNASFFRELGISWEAVMKEMTDLGTVNSVDLNVDFPANVGTNAPQTRISVGNLADDDYNAIIQAIRNDNDTQSIASPRILVRDGKEAVFTSVRDEPYTVVTVDGNTQTTLEDVRFLNVGVTLAVAPVINQDDLVTIDVQLELSDLVEFRDNIPVVDRATAQSNVSVNSGGTIILAGLLQRARTEFMRGVPGLSKIPILGGLFRNKRKEKSEREVVLILRPFIIGSNEIPVPEFGEILERNSRKLKEKRLE